MSVPDLVLETDDSNLIRNSRRYLVDFLHALDLVSSPNLDKNSVLQYRLYSRANTPFLSSPHNRESNMALGVSERSKKFFFSGPAPFQTRCRRC